MNVTVAPVVNLLSETITNPKIIHNGPLQIRIHQSLWPPEIATSWHSWCGYIHLKFPVWAKWSNDTMKLRDTDWNSQIFSVWLINVGKYFNETVGGSRPMVLHFPLDLATLRARRWRATPTSTLTSPKKSLVSGSHRFVSSSSWG